MKKFCVNGHPQFPGSRTKNRVCKKCTSAFQKNYYHAMPPEKWVQRRKRYKERLRKEFVTAYGGKCQCKCGCGEKIEGFLTLDHVDNLGGVLRKQGRRTLGELAELRRLGWPKDKRKELMCFNCNLGRNYTEGKICPRIKARV